MNAALTVLAFVGFFLAVSAIFFVPQFITEMVYRRTHPSPALTGSDGFLIGVRARSCYPVLRFAHGFVTIVAVIGTSITLLVLLAKSTDATAALYATFLCGAIIVALLIEYGLFRLIVDAVDVLIVMGQNTAANKQGDTAPGAGG